MTTDLTSQILDILSRSDDSISSQDAFPLLPSETIGAALKSLHSRDMILYNQRSRDEASLTKEGEIVVAEGSHEAKVFEAVQKAAEGLKITELPTTLLEVPVCGADCMQLRGSIIEDSMANDIVGCHKCTRNRKQWQSESTQGTLDCYGQWRVQGQCISPLNPSS